ncbi:hypothetical protein ACFV2X_25435 [Streptomyces sp. NPDC059679]|uniref:hypothetical protein n=1 Tax=Streptomyces sp. NPDC059679 TaxID=3346903 RepID=UPI0036C77733
MTWETDVNLTHLSRSLRSAGGIRLAAAAAVLALAGCSTAAAGPHPARPHPAGPAKPSARPAELPARQLPDAAARAWKPAAASRAQKTAQDIQLNECALVHGAASWRQQAYTGTHDVFAIQDTFTFRTTAQARTAQRAVAAAMGSCRRASRALQAKHHTRADAAVTDTASTASGRAWSRQWTAVAGLSAYGKQTNRIYSAWHGTALTVLQVTEPAHAPNATDAAATDRAVLDALAERLGRPAASR